MDVLDGAVVGLLHQRARHAAAVGRLKEGRQVWRPEREVQILRQITAKPGPLGPKDLVSIYRQIIGACRNLEAPFTVAVLGEGALAQGIFGPGCRVRTVATAEEALDALSTCPSALLPVGSLTTILDRPWHPAGEVLVEGCRIMVLGSCPVAPTGRDRRLTWVPGPRPTHPWHWSLPMAGGWLGALPAEHAPLGPGAHVLGTYPDPP